MFTGERACVCSGRGGEGSVGACWERLPGEGGVWRVLEGWFCRACTFGKEGVNILERRRLSVGTPLLTFYPSSA